jgi:hypothetical protein
LAESRKFLLHHFFSLQPGIQPTTLKRKNGGPYGLDSSSMAKKIVTLLVLYITNFPKYHKISKNPTNFAKESLATIEAYYHAF